MDLRNTPASAGVVERPAAQRLLEFRYRFGQSVVFGLPVVALQWFGRSLGGAESERWVALLQALLAGWVVYVAATGMLAETIMLGLWQSHVSVGAACDGLVATAAMGAYLFSLPRVVALIVPRAASHWPWTTGFHWVVIALGIWTGLRWRQLVGRARLSA
jgi:cation transport ATPase